MLKDIIKSTLINEDLMNQIFDTNNLFENGQLKIKIKNLKKDVKNLDELIISFKSKNEIIGAIHTNTIINSTLKIMNNNPEIQYIIPNGKESFIDSSVGENNIELKFIIVNTIK